MGYRLLPLQDLDRWEEPRSLWLRCSALFRVHQVEQFLTRLLPPWAFLSQWLRGDHHQVGVLVLNEPFLGWGSHGRWALQPLADHKALWSRLSAPERCHLALLDLLRGVLNLIEDGVGRPRGDPIVGRVVSLLEHLWLLVVAVGLVLKSLMVLSAEHFPHRFGLHGAHSGLRDGLLPIRGHQRRLLTGPSGRRRDRLGVGHRGVGLQWDLLRVRWVVRVLKGRSLLLELWGRSQHRSGRSLFRLGRRVRCGRRVERNRLARGTMTLQIAH